MADRTDISPDDARLFRLVVEAAPNAMVMIDGAGRITLVNSQAERIFGYPREEMIGRPVEMLINEGLRAHHVKYRNDYLAMPEARSMGTGRELLALRKDGTEFPVEIGLNPIPTPQGMGVLAAIVDISERRRAEAEREELVRLAVEAAPNAMIMVNEQGEIVLVNRQTEQMFGYKREELMGRPVEILVGEALRQRHVQYRDTYLKAPEVRAMGTGRELKGVRKDGSEFPVEIGLNPIPTRQGMLVLAAVVDISERRRAEREREDLEARVRHSQKLESLGVLAGGIAHDFNNLLAAILGNAELAELRLPPDSPAQSFISRIISASRRAAELTRQMLAYSGRGKFELKRIDPARAVEEMGELLKVSLSKKARVRYEFQPQLPQIEVDAAQFNQVILNLITNANEALIGGEGEVVVRITLRHVDQEFLASCVAADELVPGPFVEIEVADNGNGMDTATISRIFDPFFTTKFTGRGLGLSAVLGIVRGHKGTIRVESTPGRGTSFRVLLPPAAGETNGQTGQVNGSYTSAGIVLVADDEPFVRNVTCSLLENLGYKTIEAADGNQAVVLAAKHRDRLLLAVLDLTMPELDGDEAARRILADNPALPIVLASGYSPQDLTQRLRGYPNVVLLPKPFSLADLQAAVRRAMSEK